ncbi:MAG: hypothetical protein HY053_07420 [Proteobacteria bacterium]|nr:hypothetical protein [Pseudomonadota bacterium]
MAKLQLRKIERLESPPDTAVIRGDFAPIVIDLSQRRQPRAAFWSQPLLWVSAAFFCMGAAGAVGFFILNAQLQKLEQGQEQDPYFIRADNLKLPPLPQKALQTPAVSLMPILKRLPVGQDEAPPKTSAPLQGFSISVDRKRDSFYRLTDKAAHEAENGNTDAAISAYTAALRLDAQDRDAAYNLAALLLQKAGEFDTNAQWNEATPLYQKALRVWGENDAMGQAIRARLNWVQQKSVKLERAFFPVPSE